MFILEPVSKSIILLDIEMKKANEGKRCEQGGMWGHGCFRCAVRWGPLVENVVEGLPLWSSG